jgi:galactonate dehydratase
MNIARIEPVVVEGGYTNWVFVRVHTDDGLVGLGEATLEGRTKSVVTALEEIETMIRGADSARIEHIWQGLYRHPFFRGGPAWLSAVSGVEQALWDLKGKRAGLPVYELLGGACRDRLLVYANGPAGETPAEKAASARELCASGFTGLKLGILQPALPVDGPAFVREAVETVGAVRDAVGPDVRIAVDLHATLSPAMAIKVAAALEEFDIWFLEEPVLPENTAALVRVARSTRIPVATGERLFTKWGFREVLASEAIALVQPDVSHCGGILEARLIAAMAEVHYAGFAPHNPLSWVNTAASAQVAMAAPNFVALEILVGDAPWRDEIVTGVPQIVDGFLHVSDAPGLGLELDLEACAAHPFRTPMPLPTLTREDGAVADW